MSLEVQSISFNYHENEILNNISFEAEEHEILSILGPNGSGKTTLLKCINQILHPLSGIISHNNMDLRTMALKKLARYISYVPQGHSTVFPFSVVDIVLMGRIPHAGMRIRKNDIDIAFAVIELMDLKKLAFKKINQISEGERQRVIIARALAQEAPILLMDEPTSSLDIKNQLETLTLIKKIVKENGLIAILTLHDINLAAMFSDRVVMLKGSKLFKAGPVNQVIHAENLKAVYGVDTVVHNHSEEIFVKMLKPRAIESRKTHRSPKPQTK